jgi:hypothetical protein
MFLCHCRYRFSGWTYCVIWFVFSGSFHGTVRTIVAFLFGECTLCCCILCNVSLTFCPFSLDFSDSFCTTKSFSYFGFPFVCILESHSIWLFWHWIDIDKQTYLCCNCPLIIQLIGGEIFMVVACWRTGEYLVITRFGFASKVPYAGCRSG